LVSWFLGFLVSWFLGFLVSRHNTLGFKTLIFRSINALKGRWKNLPQAAQVGLKEQQERLPELLK